MGASNVSGILSPAEKRLEDQVKYLEAELEEVQKEIDKVHATPKRGDAEESAANNATLSEDSSAEDDARAEAVAITMQKQMAAEEEQMLSFVEQRTPTKALLETTKDEADEEKSAVRRLASMFEKEIKPARLPPSPSTNRARPPGRRTLAGTSETAATPSDPTELPSPPVSKVGAGEGNDASKIHQPEPKPDLSGLTPTKSPSPESKRALGSPPNPNTSIELPMPSKEQIRVSPSMPFTPEKPMDSTSLSVNTEPSASGICSDDIANQQRDPRSETNRGSPEEVTDGMDYSNETSVLSSHGQSEDSSPLLQGSNDTNAMCIVKEGRLLGEGISQPVFNTAGPPPMLDETNTPTTQEGRLEEGLLGGDTDKDKGKGKTPKRTISGGILVQGRGKVCFASTTITVKNAARRAAMCLGPCFAFLWYYLGACVVSCWIHISLLISKMTDKANTSIHKALHHARECLDYHKLVISMAPSALQYAASIITSTERGVALCCASLFVSMWSELYPTVPSCNVYLAMLLLLFQIQPGEWKETMLHSICLIVVVVASIFMDIDWLSYKYFPDSLDDEEELAYRIQQDTSLVWATAWYGILLNILFKLLCLNEALSASEHGRKIRRLIAEKAGKCFISSSTPDDLSLAVHDKVVVITWIEAICSLLCFGCFFAIELDAVSARLFLLEAPLQMLSLDGVLLLKGTSGFIVCLSLLHHIRAKDLLGLFACSSICPALRAESEDRGGRSGRRMLTRMQKSMKCIVSAKLLDFVVGVLVWMGLVSTHRQLGVDPPKDVSTLLMVVLGTQIFTTICSPSLIAVVVWYVMLSKQRRLPSRQGSMHENNRRRTTRKRDGFTSSTPRRSNHHSESNFTSRNPTRLRADFLGDFSPTPDRDYDLGQPGTAQKVFETRLSGAAARPATPSNSLELGVECEPRQFQREWSSLQQGSELSHGIQNVPILSDCHKHFHARRFHVVASGTIDGESKLFVVAQRRADNQQRKAPSRCLAEILFDSNTYEMKAEMRCRNKDETRFFLNALGLRELFGEFS